VPTSAVPGWALGLDADQRAAVEDRSSALLIVAGAGTGKTRTLVARLARLIGDGTAPDRILLVTFTRRAADEMIRRLGPLVGPEASRQVAAGTFHSIAHRLLSQHREALGLGDGFTIIDQGDAVDLMQLARQAVCSSANCQTSDAIGNRAGTDRRFPRKETLVAAYSRVANAQRPLRQVLREHFPWIQEHESAIAEVFRWYSARKRADHLLDFDDLLLYWRAAAMDPAAGPALARAFDHVLIDEYQDTNLLQADVVRSLHAGGCSVTAVGDDAQAIYAFRAATVEHMLTFGEHFPSGRVVRLERNYRSTQPILDLANAVLAEAEEGYGKRLWTDRRAGGLPELATCPDEGSEAAAVAEVVLEHYERGLALRDQAVLFRTSHHSDLLEMELRRRDIPYIKYGGLRFLEAAHVRDLVAALRILENPADELAWFRLLQLLEGVGPATARRVMGAIGVVDSASVGDAPQGARDEVQRPDSDPVAALSGPASRVPASAQAEATELCLALIDCRSPALAAVPGAQIDRLRDALEPLIRRRYDDCDVRLRDIDALARLASGYQSRARMTAELILDPPVSTGDLAGAPHLDDDYLVLSTVHSAKGGEWRAVHLIHASDGSFPSDMATGSRREIEEERRLFYVALTRAKEHLHIYAPLRFHLGGPAQRQDRHSYSQRTRFLPSAVDTLLEHRPVRSRPEDTGMLGVRAPLHDAVTDTLNSLW
jgi:DNA helicase-2/ATP-dependent DNA helicase PcrA